MINSLITELLKGINVPIKFHRYEGDEKTYITFHEYHQSGMGYEEDNEKYTGHYIQLDVWSDSDYTELVNSIKLILSTEDFRRLDEADLFEEDTGIYHKGLRFYYLEEREELLCQDK